MNIDEGIRLKAEWEINKFVDPTGEIAKALQAGMPITKARRLYGNRYLGRDRIKGNLGLNEGLQELIDIICGLGTPTKWDSANARLGVGNSNTAADPTQIGLQGASKTWKAMDSTYPQRSAQTAEWRSTFGSADANYTWEEYTVVNAADDAGKNLNRKVESKGTKASGEIPYLV